MVIGSLLWVRFLTKRLNGLLEPLIGVNCEAIASPGCSSLLTLSQCEIESCRLRWPPPRQTAYVWQSPSMAQIPILFVSTFVIVAKAARTPPSRWSFTLIDDSSI